VTDSAAPAHSIDVLGVASLPSADEPTRAPSEPAAVSFETLYDDYFPYVWRAALRLGVPLAHADDVVQEVFLVVYRKLGEFQGRSTLKTWLYGIALRVARAHRLRLRSPAGAEVLDAEQVRAPDAVRPDERAQNAEAARLVSALLEGLDDDQREVFVLAELEELTVPEIAEILGVKLNTVYSRLRLARAAFSDAVARHRARDTWRMR
jgi:RNA polymerase sigma-70 factor (ECF subfamily)